MSECLDAVHYQDPTGYAGTTSASLKVATNHVLEEAETKESEYVDAAEHLDTDDDFPFLSTRPKYEPYSYDRLSVEDASIRLLRMELTDEMQPRIACSIQHVRLDDPQRPNYTTLSYAWGESLPDGSHLTEILPCDGGYLRITKTLRQALISILQNHSDGAIFLWADAVCINQADTCERNQQVKLMPDIYSRCGDMVVWLGELSEDAENWLSLISVEFPGLWTRSRPKTASMSRSCGAHDFYPELSGLSAFTTSAMPESLRQLLENPHPELDFTWVSNIKQALGCYASSLPLTELTERFAVLKPRQELFHAKLTQRAWFHRKWVLQEMALTSRNRQTFLIGDHVKTFNEMAKAVRAFTDQNEATPLDVVSSDQTLLQNLVRYQRAECCEPRDHIYSLIGISKDGSEFVVDYNCNVEELYRHVAQHYMHDFAIEIMILASARKPLGSLPSWVPDWRQPWRSDRSANHSRLLRLSSSEDRDIRRSINSSLDKTVDGFTMLAWILTRCDPRPRSGIKHCGMCRILRGSTFCLHQPKTDDVKHRLCQDSRAYAQYLVSEDARKRWGAIIAEELTVNMGWEEVLCFVRDCAVAFVLSPVTSVIDRKLPAYRLEYCFQVDEISVTEHFPWVPSSRWFEYSLGGEFRQFGLRLIQIV